MAIVGKPPLAGQGILRGVFCLGLQAALDYCHSTPLPGEAAEPEEVDTLADGEDTPSDPKTPF